MKKWHRNRATMASCLVDALSFSRTLHPVKTDAKASDKRRDIGILHPEKRTTKRAAEIISRTSSNPASSIAFQTRYNSHHHDDEKAFGSSSRERRQSPQERCHHDCV
jgi:hypothetical protein